MNSVSASRFARYYWLRSLHRLRDTFAPIDLALVYPSGEGDWVLGGICRHISRQCSVRAKLYSGLDNLPKAKACFLAHYSMLGEYLAKYSHDSGSRLLVYYTHPRDIGVPIDQLILSFNEHAYKVITMNSGHRDHLISLGVVPEKVEAIIGGADETIFLPGSHRNSGPATVGLCVGFRDSPHYRERKDFDRIVDSIKALSEYRVLLVGHGWREYERFGELCALPWFEYVECCYEEYPSQYRRMSVFASLSRLEGGPIPVIEALSCNLPVVATCTGMSPDVIQDGFNGCLLPVDASVEEVVRAVGAAMKLNCDFRASMLPYNWRGFAKRLVSCAGLLP